MRTVGLATKLSIGVALVVTVSLGTLSVVTVMASRRSLREQVQSANLVAATLTARAVERYVADAAGIMREASGRPKLGDEVRSANWPEVSRVLENFLRSFTQFENVAVLDSQGIVRVRVPHAGTVGQDFSFRDYFREAMRTRRLYISGVFVSRSTARPVVAIAVPVLRGPDEVAGVIVGGLSLGALTQFIATIGHEDGLVYVVDGRGRLIASSRMTGAVGPGVEVKSLPIVQAALAGRSGSQEFQEPGAPEPLLGAHVPIAELGWGVVAARPLSVAYAAGNRLARWLLWLTAGFTVGAIVVGWALARTLTGPLSRLAAATERLGAGDLSVRVARESQDEVGALALSFSGMAAHLESSYRALEEKTREVGALNRELEQRVIDRTHQLEAANRELEAFTYTVSHDLKAPLRGVEGFARAIEEDYGGRLDAAGTRYLGLIQTGARRMGQLIDDLLRYSRLERREMRHEPVELRRLVERACEELEEEIRTRRLRVRIDLEAETVPGEPEGLREAVANLVGNAVKFSPDGDGAITIASRREGDEVMVSVTDIGIGFDMKYHDRIFGIFERLHRQEDYPGTGVGLAIVRKVADRHGGRAWAVSEPGKGSTFYLALPVAQGRPMSGPVPPLAMPATIDGSGAR